MARPRKKKDPVEPDAAAELAAEETVHENQIGDHLSGQDYSMLEGVESVQFDDVGAVEALPGSDEAIHDESGNGDAVDAATPDDIEHVDGNDKEAEDTAEVEDGEDGEENGENEVDEDNGDDENDTEEEEDGESSPGTALPMTAIVEAVLFAAREPLKIAQLARAVGKRTRQDAVREAIVELNVQYLETGRAFEIAEISGRYQLMSRPEYSEHIMRIYPKKELTDKENKTQRLTPAMMDTLAIIAYKQPVMRSEIEHIRGVSCSNALRALIERGSVREIGRRADLVGKPGVFGTTERFLAEFGLGSLDELPMRNEFMDPGAPPVVEMTVFEDGGEDEKDNADEVHEVPSAEQPSLQEETVAEESEDSEALDDNDDADEEESGEDEEDEEDEDVDIDEEESDV